MGEDWGPLSSLHKGTICSLSIPEAVCAQRKDLSYSYQVSVGTRGTLKKFGVPFHSTEPDPTPQSSALRSTPGPSSGTRIWSPHSPVPCPVPTSQCSWEAEEGGQGSERPGGSGLASSSHPTEESKVHPAPASRKWAKRRHLGTQPFIAQEPHPS